MGVEELTVEAVDGLLPEAAGDPSVNTLVLVTLELQEVLKQVQHLSHLSQQEHNRSSFRQDTEITNVATAKPNAIVKTRKSLDIMQNEQIN